MNSTHFGICCFFYRIHNRNLINWMEQQQKRTIATNKIEQEHKLLQRLLLFGGSRSLVQLLSYRSYFPSHYAMRFSVAQRK